MYKLENQMEYGIIMELLENKTGQGGQGFLQLSLVFISYSVFGGNPALPALHLF